MTATITFNKEIASVRRIMESAQADSESSVQMWDAQRSYPFEDTTRSEKSRTQKDRSTFVLRSEAALELGAPEKGSCLALIASEDLDAVHDGRVILIGNDVDSQSERSLAFAMVVLAAGEEMSPGAYLRATEDFVPHDIEGCMLRVTTNDIWCRISYEAVENGLKLVDLGHAVINALRSGESPFERIEVIMVAGDTGRVHGLKEALSDVPKKVMKMRFDTLEERGVDIDESMNGGHCGQCEDKNTCNRVRRISREYHRSSGTGELIAMQGARDVS